MWSTISNVSMPSWFSLPIRKFYRNYLHDSPIVLDPNGFIPADIHYDQHFRRFLKQTKRESTFSHGDINQLAANFETAMNWVLEGKLDYFSFEKSLEFLKWRLPLLEKYMTPVAYTKFKKQFEKFTTIHSNTEEKNLYEFRYIFYKRFSDIIHQKITPQQWLEDLKKFENVIPTEIFQSVYAHAQDFYAFYFENIEQNYINMYQIHESAIQDLFSKFESLTQPEIKPEEKSFQTAHFKFSFSYENLMTFLRKASPFLFASTAGAATPFYNTYGGNYNFSLQAISNIGTNFLGVGVITYPSSDNDLILTNYSLDGNIITSFGFGGKVNYVELFSSCYNNQSLVSVGEVNSNGLIFVYNGTIQKSLNVNPSSPAKSLQLLDIKMTYDNGYILASQTNDVYGVGQGTYDHGIIKLDTNFNFVWGTAFGSHGNDWAYSIVEDPVTHNVLVGGQHADLNLAISAFSSAGSYIKNRIYGTGQGENAYAFIPRRNGGYAGVGFSYFLGSQPSSFLFFLDSNLTLQQAFAFGMSSTDAAYSLYESALDQGIVFGGSYAGKNYVAKFLNNSLTWFTAWGLGQINSVKELQNGQVSAAGGSNGYGARQTMTFTILQSDGSLSLTCVNNTAPQLVNITSNLSLLSPTVYNAAWTITLSNFTSFINNTALNINQPCGIVPTPAVTPNPTPNPTPATTQGPTPGPTPLTTTQTPPTAQENPTAGLASSSSAKNIPLIIGIIVASVIAAIFCFILGLLIKAKFSKKKNPSGFFSEPKTIEPPVTPESSVNDHSEDRNLPNVIDDVELTAPNRRQYAVPQLTHSTARYPQTSDVIQQTTFNT